MTRRKVDRKAKLVKKVTVRMSESFYNRMEEWLANSNCRSLAELARAILYREQIIWYHKDAKLESTAIELAGIKKELNAIGRNINQITHRFHSTDLPNQKMFHALKISDEYKKVGDKVDKLLVTTAIISKKWLRG
ncbi:MAG TPA: plasmid mobilization relaxosome protein MobC [Cyclobacteriaceae bacterium]|nr:plasmid mobilization relaxosome protein MobC [Cyclobacteriaceae bacterium]